MSAAFEMDGSLARASFQPDERRATLERFGSRRLNLGCGWDIRPGYINVDGQAAHGPDLVGDIIDLNMLPSDSFDEAIAQDVLEHFHWRDTPRALYEWNRLLRPNGKLFIRTTYLNGLFRKFEEPEWASIEGQKQLVICLFSMQKYPGDYHLTAFSERLMRFYLWLAGFTIDTISLNGGWLFEIWASKTEDRGYGALVNGMDGDAAFLRRCYEAILGRAPDEVGLQEFSDLLATGSMSRDAVVKSLLMSDENQNAQTARAPEFDLIFHERRELATGS